MKRYVCGEFSLSSAPSDQILDLPENALSFFSIGAQPVCAGYAEKADDDIGTSFSVTVNGRTRGADIVDSAPISQQTVYKNQKIESIIADLAAPFGLRVDALVDTGAAIPTMKIDPGQSVYEAIKKELKKKRLLIHDTPLGVLEIFRAGEKKSIDSLEAGRLPFIRAKRSRDFSNRFSIYECVGQSRQSRAPLGVFMDAEIQRPRKKRIIAEEQVDNASANDRARWEAALARASGSQLSVELSSWQQSDGSLWRAGYLVDLTISEIGLRQESFLIKSVSRNYSTTTNDTTLTLVAPGAYD